MRVKEKSVCQTCRARKLGCDGKRPNCTQCTLRGRICDWSTPAWTFVTAKEPTSIDSYGPRHGHMDICASRKFIIESITRAYIPREELSHIYPGSGEAPRICGAWVGVLSTLAEGSSTRYDSVLSPAVTALSSCIMPKADAQSVKDYSDAVDALRSNAQELKVLDAEFAAAIMCLFQAEIMLPDSRFGLAMHMNGVAQLFQASGPSMFKSGALQSLFVGFRPLFMVQSVQTRKSTFIASKDWIDIPFSASPPSLMQQLINVSLVLPSLLERVDRLSDVSSELLTAEILDLGQSFSHLHSRLEKWEEALHGQSMWSPPSDSNSRSSPLGADIWFTSITMANFYMHIWAFQIICILELSNLADVHTFRSWTLPKGPTTIQAASLKICLSMNYLLQEEMKLFGPASAMLPLQTAYKVFSEDKCKYMRELHYLEGIVDCLVKKGIRSTPDIVYS